MIIKIKLKIILLIKYIYFKMSLQIIFPNEDKMKVKDLDHLKENLLKILPKNIDLNEINNLNKCLGEIQGYLLVADRKNLKEYFDYFCKLNFLDLFNNFYEKKKEGITFSMLEMVSFLREKKRRNNF